MTRSFRAALTLAAAIACAACGGPAAPDRPDVVLVTVDTLRADHCSAYGYARPTTPFLEELAGRGVRMTRAYSSSSWTTPSVVSMLVSRHPSAHGVVHGVFARGKVMGQERIPEDLPVLAERFREHGYRTFGLTANAMLAAKLGFDRGFDRYRCVEFGEQEDLAPVLEEWSGDLAAGGPYFLWVHLLDPHAPYTAREPWLTEFWPPPKPRFPKLSRNRFPRTLEGRRFSRDSLGYLRAAYDSEIRRTDEFVRTLLEETLPADRERIVLFTSDHGEVLGERGFGHGVDLFDLKLRIPMVFVLPESADAPAPGATVDLPVSLVDVAPTLLDLVGAPVPPNAAGRSLAPLLTGGGLEAGGSLEARPLIAEFARNRVLRSIRDGRWKLIEHPEEEGADELFDLGADPTESVNRLQEEEARAGELHRALADMLGETRRAPTVDIPKERADQLEALGYVDP